MSVSICCALPHKSSDPFREAALYKLLPRLVDFDELVIETGPGPQDVWSYAMWVKALTTGCDYIVCITDDTLVCDNFSDVIRAMVAALPGETLALSSEHHKGPTLLAQGHRWYKCLSWVAGWGYCIPAKRLIEFLFWRQALSVESLRKCGEDHLINLYQAEMGFYSYHPLPAPLEHNIALPSTYEPNGGACPTKEQTTTVPWYEYVDWPEEMTVPGFWASFGANIPFLKVPSEGG